MRIAGLFLVLSLATLATAVRGAVPRAVSDEHIVAQARRVASGQHVDLYQHGVDVDPAFATMLGVYYFASRRFVSYLVELKGMEVFMRLYASETPETTIRSLYGISREEAVRAALTR